MNNINDKRKNASDKIAKAFNKDLFWVYDKFETWNLRFVHEKIAIHAFIQKRPHYCDRGHYQLNIDIHDPEHFGPYLDRQDGFPRYYMDFETAVMECESFLIWRLLKIPMEQQ